MDIKRVSAFLTGYYPSGQGAAEFPHYQIALLKGSPLQFYTG